ncbi:MAG: hypothetical protein AAGF93_12175 [Cyanobacteria bacterium P01_H01_bin.105]
MHKIGRPIDRVRDYATPKQLQGNRVTIDRIQRQIEAGAIAERNQHPG